MFLEEVEVDGKKLPRFEYIREYEHVQTNKSEKR